MKRDCPSAGITMSQANSNSEPGTGSALRRPLASGSPRRVSTNLTAGGAAVALDDLDGLRQPVEPNAFDLGVIVLEGEGRHFLFGAAVEQVDFFGAQTPGGVGGVDGGVAAADDHHAPAHLEIVARSCSAR